MVAANTSLPDESYVPILKCKMGELGAAESCLLDTVVPLFEVRDPEASATKLLKAWPAASGVAWIHSLNLSGADEQEFAESVSTLFTLLQTEMLAVPVITTSESSAMLRTVAEIVSVQDRGVVLRLEPEELLATPEATWSGIDEVLAACGVPPHAVDVVVDAGFVAGTPATRAAVVNQALRTLPSGDWRNLVVAFSAFPQDMSTVDKDSVGEFPRQDAAAFELLPSRETAPPLIYADYTIGVPSHAEAGFLPIPNIKYTDERTWKIHRGAARTNPTPQYRALASDLVAAPYFAADQSSPCDEYLRTVANGSDGPGNAMTHLRAGISRHVHVVAYRLANLGVP